MRNKGKEAFRKLYDLESEMEGELTISIIIGYSLVMLGAIIMSKNEFGSEVLKILISETHNIIQEKETAYTEQVN